MERVLLWLLLLLSFSVSCFSAGEKDRGFQVGQSEGNPSRHETIGDGSKLCLCSGSQRLQKQKKHGHVCPCDQFIMPRSGRHHRHTHHKNRELPHHRKHKCRDFQSNCKHRKLMKGLQIPL
ncbi:uncharacterized protein LOC143837164 [Paroedura picta]|uniref:uncharacterized protein LOC143837164 n=1 Tax=Paroedura picta TaxID=143630 RepID=UPI004056170A